MVEEWSGPISGEITGTTVQFDFALSNIDDAAPDGITGDTEIEVELRLETAPFPGK